MWYYLRKLLSNPMAVFVYGILSKWYILIAVSSLVVTFWVFQGLKEAKVLDDIEKVVMQALSDTKSVAKNCVPKIKELNAFWHCLENLPEYKPSQQEQALEKELLDSAPKQPHEDLDPYN